MDLANNWKSLASDLQSQLTAATDKLARAEAERDALVEALEELIEVADLRGDSSLPHPADDPKLWTARMQTAWDDAREAIAKWREGGAG